MLFINPIGGKKKGVKIWEKDVQPLMTIAGIETKMMITERAGHIRDALLTADLSDLHVSPANNLFYVHVEARRSDSANKRIYINLENFLGAIFTDLLYLI